MLSLRLKTLHGFYHGEENIWDIGCDHGLLGLSFKDSCTVKQINLVDPSGPVIDVLKKNIDSYITMTDIFISIQHKKGQHVTLSQESNLVFIAGMGGSEIHEILLSLIPQLTIKDRIVISPHRKILELRQFLHHSSLNLETETIVEESGQFYQVLALSLDKNNHKVSLYGEKLWFTEVGEKYKNQQIAAFSAHQDELSRGYVSYLKSL